MPDLIRSHSLHSVPDKKLHAEIEQIQRSSENLNTKSVRLIAVNRYAESNIPIGYWSLRMKDFRGDARLKERYDQYVRDLHFTYRSGTSVCFAGKHGVGKTMTLCSILKDASLKGYSCLYTTLSDVVSTLTSAPDRHEARMELRDADFLAIDEVDQRFFSQSDAAGETFARMLELVIRPRMQNQLPTLLATNSPQIKETFTSLFKDSLGSLMSKIEVFSVMPGADFRKEERK